MKKIATLFLTLVILNLLAAFWAKMFRTVGELEVSEKRIRGLDRKYVDFELGGKSVVTVELDKLGRNLISINLQSPNHDFEMFYSNDKNSVQLESSNEKVFFREGEVLPSLLINKKSNRIFEFSGDEGALWKQIR